MPSCGPGVSARSTSPSSTSRPASRSGSRRSSAAPRARTSVPISCSAPRTSAAGRAARRALPDHRDRHRHRERARAPPLAVPERRTGDARSALVPELLDAYRQAARADAAARRRGHRAVGHRRPAELLRCARPGPRARAGHRDGRRRRGHPRRSALLPLLRPDVIKLDLRLVQHQPSRDDRRDRHRGQRRGRAHAARSSSPRASRPRSTSPSPGRSVRRSARAGSSAGPVPLPARCLEPRPGPVCCGPCGRSRAGRDAVRDLRGRARGPTGRKALLIEMSKHLEAEARSAGEGRGPARRLPARPPPHPGHRAALPRARRASWRSSAAIGEDLPVEPVAGRARRLPHPDDPFRGRVGRRGRRPALRRRADRQRPRRRRARSRAPVRVRRHLRPRPRSWPRPDGLPRAGVAPTPGRSAAPVAAGRDLRVATGRGATSPPWSTGPSPLHLRALAAADQRGHDRRRPRPRPAPRVRQRGVRAADRVRGEDIIGRNCRFLQGPDTDVAAVRRFGEVLRRDGGGQVRLLNYRADGTPWWNEVTISAGPRRRRCADPLHRHPDRRHRRGGGRTPARAPRLQRRAHGPAEPARARRHARRDARDRRPGPGDRGAVPRPRRLPGGQRHARTRRR